MLNYKHLSTKRLITAILLIFCTLSCKYGQGSDKRVEHLTNTTSNQIYTKCNPAIRKIIDSYSDRSKLYLFHFGSMTCAPCLHKFELFKRTERHSDQYCQVILILLEDDKKEFENRFNLSEHGMDIFIYKEKGITIEDLKAIGATYYPCSILYDGRGGYITNDEKSISRMIFSYKLGCMATTLKYDPKDYNAHLDWGQRLLSLHQYDDAIAEFELCKQISPDKSDAPIQLSSLYFRTGKYEKALEEIELIIPKTSEEIQMSLKNYLEIMKKEVARIEESIKKEDKSHEQ